MDVSPLRSSAPLAAGARVGEVVYSDRCQVIRRVDLVAAAADPKGNFSSSIRDAFAKLFAKDFRNRLKGRPIGDGVACPALGNESLRDQLVERVDDSLSRERQAGRELVETRGPAGADGP